MSNTVAVWFEIPTNHLDRAQAFYEAVTGAPLKREKSPCGTLEMAMFVPSGAGEAPAQGCVVKGENFRPNAEGTMVYLNGGDDLAPMLSRVEAAGGAILMPKTSIAPHGFIAVIEDTDGNRVGLHSTN